MCDRFQKRVRRTSPRAENNDLCPDSKTGGLPIGMKGIQVAYSGFRVDQRCLNTVQINHLLGTVPSTLKSLYLFAPMFYTGWSFDFGSCRSERSTESCRTTSRTAPLCRTHPALRTCSSSEAFALWSSMHLLEDPLDRTCGCFRLVEPRGFQTRKNMERVDV